MSYLLRRISVSSALLYGLLLGLILWLVPGVLLGWLTRSLVSWVLRWMGALQVDIPLLPGEGVTIDLGTALGLTSLETRLTALAAQSTALAIAVTLGAVAAGMLLSGIIAALAALLYNFFAGIFGGVQVTLNPLGRVAVPASTGVAVAKRGGASPAASAAGAEATTAIYRPSASTTRPPGAWLAAADKPDVRWPLAAGITRIGSSQTNDIVLPGLAPQHAEIRLEDGHYVVYDLGSRRTWVNSVQVASAHNIRNGYRIQFGQTEWVAHIAAAPPGHSQ